MSIDANHEIFYGYAFRTTVLAKKLKAYIKRIWVFKQLRFKSIKNFVADYIPDSRNEVFQVTINAHTITIPKFDTHTGRPVDPDVRNYPKQVFWVRKKDYTLEWTVAAFWLLGHDRYDIDDELYTGDDTFFTDYGGKGFTEISWSTEAGVRFLLQAHIPKKYLIGGNKLFVTRPQDDDSDYTYLTSKNLFITYTSGYVDTSVRTHAAIPPAEALADLFVVAKDIGQRLNINPGDPRLVHLYYVT